MKKLLFTSIALALLITNSHANQSTSPGAVTAIQMGYPDKSVFFSISAPLANPASCPNNYGSYWTAGEATADVKNMAALLLAARLSGTNVVLTVSGSECMNGWPKVTNVKM